MIFVIITPSLVIVYLYFSLTDLTKCYFDFDVSQMVVEKHDINNAELISKLIIRRHEIPKEFTNSINYRSIVIYKRPSESFSKYFYSV